MGGAGRTPPCAGSPGVGDGWGLAAAKWQRRGAVEKGGLWRHWERTGGVRPTARSWLFDEGGGRWEEGRGLSDVMLWRTPRQAPPRGASQGDRGMSVQYRMGRMCGDSSTGQSADAGRGLAGRGLRRSRGALGVWAPRGLQAQLRAGCAAAPRKQLGERNTDATKHVRGPKASTKKQKTARPQRAQTARMHTWFLLQLQWRVPSWCSAATVRTGAWCSAVTVRKGPVC